MQGALPDQPAPFECTHVVLLDGTAEINGHALRKEAVTALQPGTRHTCYLTALSIGNSKALSLSIHGQRCTSLTSRQQTAS